MLTAMQVNHSLCTRILSLTALMAASFFAMQAAAAASQDDAAAWAALRKGAIVLFRHANAPGVGDPPGFKLRDCSTQRNLDELGRDQARNIGAKFRKLAVKVGAVKTSQWCRAKETAELAFPSPSSLLGIVREEPAFNSFFDNIDQRATQTAAAKAQLLNWKGPDALVVFSHQINITAITGIAPASAEGVVMQREGDSLKVVGRITP